MEDEDVPDEELDQWLKSFQEERIPIVKRASPIACDVAPPRKKHLRVQCASAEQLVLAPFVEKDADERYFGAQSIPFPLDVSREKRHVVIKVVFSAFDTKCELDLRKIATSARNVEYNSKKSSIACFMRLRNPVVTASIYEKGRVAIVGGKTLADSKLGAKKVARLLQRSGHPNVVFGNYRVENITAVFDLEYPVRIEAFAIARRAECTYEPELSPSLFYRLPNCKTTVQVWSSGKTLITGAKSISELQHVVGMFEPLAASFQT